MENHLSEHKAKKLIEAFCRYATDHNFEHNGVLPKCQYVIDQSMGDIAILCRWKTYTEKLGVNKISGYVYAAGTTFVHLLERLIAVFNQERTFFGRKHEFTGITSSEEFELKLAVLSYI